jgi:hypothetical protein
MIDRETALSWAKDAGFGTYSMDALLCTARDLQSLITRAQNEAFEQAAQEVRFADNGTEAAELIRALKEQA